MANWASDEQLRLLMTQMDTVDKGLTTEIDVQQNSPRAWLKLKDGQISFIHSDNSMNGDLPVIEAIPPLKLVVNGAIVEGPQRVEPDDKISWHAEQKNFRIDISEDKMKVRLRLLPDGQYMLKLADQEMTDKLILKAVEDVYRPIAIPNLQAVLEVIQDLGIVHYELEAITSELISPTFVPILIGKGKEPIPGKDAVLELFFNEQIEDSFEELNGVIDFRNRLKIPSVRKGERIARKVAMNESVPGYNVFGDKVDAPRVKDCIMLGRQHVNVVENEAFASKDGRPRVTGDIIKMIDITIAHVVPGDVDLKTGNMLFRGDIHIYGNVNDGMIVEALGDVYVSGNVYHATITATGSIYIKGNTIGSKLYSGHFGVLFNRMFNHSTKLNERLSLYRQAADKLIQMAQERGHAVTDRQVHQVLMESKFSDVPELCHIILDCISSIQSIQKNNMNDLKKRLETLLKPSLLQQDEIGPFIMDVQQQLLNTIENIRRSEEAEVRTEIQHCHLSEIFSNGDILIRQKGVLQSRLYSKKNIIFYQSDAVCRGSDLEAGNTISAMIVGGASGGSTQLKAGKKVMASLMNEGKVIVGKFSKEILDPVENVCFQVKNNRLVEDSINLHAGENRHVTS